MQAMLERILGEARAGVAMQFLRFGTVGAGGVVVDTATVYALRGTIGIYAAGAAAYVVAATFTWFFNRLWAFRSATRTAAGRQWAVFLATQSVGFVVNRGVFALLVTFSAFCATYPVVAIAAGVAAGMFLNFAAARRYVFVER
jgi:putative flippase GtrA